MRVTTATILLTLVLFLLPQTAQAQQTGDGWDYVLNNPFTLMGRSRGHSLSFDAATYAAANYSVLFSSEANVNIIAEGEAQGLPWHHHVQASQSGANNGFGGLNQQLKDQTWAAWNAATNPASSAHGWHIWDEPRGYHINQGYVTETFDWVRQTFPDQLDYTVTLGPFSDAASYWGGPNIPAGGYTFQDYQDDLITMVQPDLLLYDSYIFPLDGGTSNPIWGPLNVSDAAKAAGIPYWAYMQSFGSNSLHRRVPSESDIRLHVFTHLAFGFSGIVYFTYEPSVGPAQVDANGVPEQLYYDVQKLNPEAFHLGERIKTLSHRSSYWVPNNGGIQYGGISHWVTFKQTANADPRITDIGVTTPDPLDEGKDAMLSVLRDESTNTRYFMVNNMYNEGNLTAAAAELDHYVQFDWTVDHVFRIDRHTGQEVLVPLTNNRLDMTLPGGTANLYRHGTYTKPTILTTHFTEDFESSTDPGYTPGALLNNQNGWTIATGNPILPIGADNPGDNFDGQFIDGPAAAAGTQVTIHRNPAGIGGGLDPNRVSVLTWDWELDQDSHAQRLGFHGSDSGADTVRQIELAVLEDLGMVRLEFQYFDSGGQQQEIQYDIHEFDFTSGEALEFELVIDGTQNLLWGIAGGRETDRIAISDQLIADIEGIQLLVVNEPNRRYPKLDDILLVSGLPPSGHDTDINNDGVVDGKDFLAIQRFDPSLLGQWAIDYGGAPSVAVASSAQTAVPEPSTGLLTLLCLGWLAAATSSRRDFR